MACRLVGTIRNKLQWHFDRNSIIFIQENALEDVVCQMASILSRLHCVELNTIYWEIEDLWRGMYGYNCVCMFLFDLLKAFDMSDHNALRVDKTCPWVTYMSQSTTSNTYSEWIGSSLYLAWWLLAPSHCLNQSWRIVYWRLRNKPERKSNQNKTTTATTTTTTKIQIFPFAKILWIYRRYFVHAFGVINRFSSRCCLASHHDFGYFHENSLQWSWKN